MDDVSAILPDNPDATALRDWVRHGREEDFRGLVQRHLQLVRGIARRQLGDDLAEDTTQLVFTILARKAPSLTDIRSLAAWLHRVTVLQCRSAIRRKIRDRRSQSAAMENARLHDARDPLLDALPHVDSAIARLSASDQELLLLRYSEGLTFAEAAARTGRSEAALRQQAGRALERLSADLRRHGVPVPAATLAGGLGLVLSGPGTAEAEALVSAAAVTGAAALSGSTLAALTFATMTTTQSLLAGAAAAVLLLAVPVTWQARQIAEARAATPPPPSASANILSHPADTSSALPEPAADKSPAAPELPPDAAPLEQIEAMAQSEMRTAGLEWARRSAWLQARRAGYGLALSRETEDALREYLEGLLTARMARGLDLDDGSGEHRSSQDERRDYQEKLNAWLAERLTPQQFVRHTAQEAARREAQVEMLAEDALHSYSSLIPLTEEQKTALFQAAAAKAGEALDQNDYQAHLGFGASIAAPPAPPVEEASPELLASVLDPAQQELWQQSVAQDRLFSDEMPRHLADRTLNYVRDAGLATVVAAMFRGAMSDGDQPAAPETP